MPAIMLLVLAACDPHSCVKNYELVLRELHCKPGWTIVGTVDADAADYGMQVYTSNSLPTKPKCVAPNSIEDPQ